MPITRARLTELLEYDGITGVFTWKKGFRGHVKAGDIAGWARKDGYISLKIDGVKEYGHRLAWLYMFGVLPDKEIDHIDHNPSNNSISNLRLVTRQKNCMNSSLGRRNKSGVIGVHWAKHASAWSAQIGINKKTFALGYFDSIEQAAFVRAKAESSLGFHKNHGARK